MARSPENHMLVLLSNHPKFLGKLDESTRSSLQPEMIHFRNYDANQLKTILESRARAGLYEMPHAAIAQIAALTTRDANSDVRVAIKTLYYAALEQKEDVERVFSRARRDLVRDVLADLSDHNILIVQAVAECPDRFVKSIYDRYRQLALSVNEGPFSYVYFYSNLSYLQSIGMILLLTTKTGQTYTNRVQLLFDPRILGSIWAMRFG